jgi:heme O synthase-like polyprenyltransferase
MYRDDYARGGIRMLPVIEPDTIDWLTLTISVASLAIMIVPPGAPKVLIGEVRSSSALTARRVHTIDAYRRPRSTSLPKVKLKSPR